MKKLLGIGLGVLFAVIVMPKLAKMSLAAKYPKGGMAYAAESKPEKAINTCTDVRSKANNLGQVVLKIKCRNEMPSN